MTTQYDRVSYPDKVQFASEPDDHDEVGHETGNGIYNDYTVQIQPKQYREPFKIACFRIERTRRTAFVLFGILAVLIMVILIIVIAAHAHTSANNAANKRRYGLFAYPKAKDGSSVISFNNKSYDSYKHYFENIEAQITAYDTVTQENQLDKYVKCNYVNMTAENLTAGQVCMQTFITFGPNCQHVNLYGYMENKPCILLILRLNEHAKPSVYSASNEEVKKIVDESASQKYIAVTCEGKTDKGPVTIETEYHPKLGFPQFFYPGKNDKSFIDPAVMVQFRSLQSNVEVKVRCTAWVNNDENTSPQDYGSIFSTEFTLKLT